MTVLGRVSLEALKITALVLLMMVAVDALNVVTQGRLKALSQGGRWRQYIGAAFLGVLPGCLGSFAAVSLYVHGMLSFGALVGNMIATSGDEAFVMLAMFPRLAIGLFSLLFILGMGFAGLADRLLLALRFHPRANCRRDVLHPGEAGLHHYLREHLWHHLLREHLWRVFLWTLGALAVVEIGLKQGNLESFVT